MLHQRRVVWRAPVLQNRKLLDEPGLAARMQGECLGQGSYGLVILAQDKDKEDKKTGKQWAIKFMERGDKVMMWVAWTDACCMGA